METKGENLLEPIYICTILECFDFISNAFRFKLFFI